MSLQFYLQGVPVVWLYQYSWVFSFIFRVCRWFGSTKTDESSVLSSGCAGGLVVPRLLSLQFYLQGVPVVWLYQDCWVFSFIFRVCRWFGSTKTDVSFAATNPPAHPEDVDGVSFRNVRKPSYPNAVVFQRKLHSIDNNISSNKTESCNCRFIPLLNARRVEVYLHLFLILALCGNEWLVSISGHI